MRAGSAAALAAVLIAFLSAGLWLGGHPNDLPRSVRDVFVDESTTLSGEAAETIEDHYYRGVSRDQLNNGSITGMVNALRSRHTRRIAFRTTSTQRRRRYSTSRHRGDSRVLASASGR